MTFDPATASGAVVEFSYTNRVPVATIDTEATDVADADHVVELDGKSDSTFTIVDRVSYCGLVPGTGYSLVGVLRPNAVDASAVDGTTTFVPDAPCGTESVTFDVRGDSGLRGQIAVVTETLTLASTGRVIAQHDDPLDVDQTIHFLPTATVVVTAPPITPPPTPPATTGTTEPATTEPATTIAASTTSTTPVESAPPTPPTTVVGPPPGSTLPRTGGGDGARRTVAIGSWMLLLGAALFAVTARRPDPVDERRVSRS